MSMTLDNNYCYHGPFASLMEAAKVGKMVVDDFILQQVVTG